MEAFEEVDIKKDNDPAEEEEEKIVHCWLLSVQKVPIRPEYIGKISRKWPSTC